MRTCRQSGNPGNNFKDVSSGPKYVAEFSDMSLLMQEAISQSELTEAGINRKTISRVEMHIQALSFFSLFFSLVLGSYKMFSKASFLCLSLCILKFISYFIC